MLIYTVYLDKKFKMRRTGKKSGKGTEWQSYSVKSQFYSKGEKLEEEWELWVKYQGKKSEQQVTLINGFQQIF